MPVDQLVNELVDWSSSNPFLTIITIILLLPGSFIFVGACIMFIRKLRKDKNN